MFEFDGKAYSKLALHGGGCSMLGHHVGFLEETGIFENPASSGISLVTSSAGSLAVLICIFRRMHADLPVGMMYDLVCDEMMNVFHRLEGMSILSNEFFKSLFHSHPDLLDLTFADLKVTIPALEWTICCSEAKTFDLKTFGTHTEDVRVWEACLASASLPVLCEGFWIRGSLNMDGDYVDWVRGLGMEGDTDCLHILSKRFCEESVTYDTGLRLLDEVLSFFHRCHFRLSQRSLPEEGVFYTPLQGCLNKNPLSNEFVDEGKKTAQKLVLK